VAVDHGSFVAGRADPGPGHVLRGPGWRGSRGR
jgi:hypothetical protein